MIERAARFSYHDCERFLRSEIYGSDKLGQGTLAKMQNLASSSGKSSPSVIPTEHNTPFRLCRSLLIPPSRSKPVPCVMIRFPNSEIKCCDTASCNARLWQ